jgi:hypothetical protein
MPSCCAIFDAYYPPVGFWYSKYRYCAKLWTVPAPVVSSAEGILSLFLSLCSKTLWLSCTIFCLNCVTTSPGDKGAKQWISTHVYNSVLYVSFRPARSSPKQGSGTCTKHWKTMAILCGCLL